LVEDKLLRHRTVITLTGLGRDGLVLAVIALFAVNVVLTTIGVRFGTGN
jgi:hypothetical protein